MIVDYSRIESRITSGSWLWTETMFQMRPARLKAASYSSLVTPLASSVDVTWTWAAVSADQEQGRLLQVLDDESHEPPPHCPIDDPVVIGQ